MNILIPAKSTSTRIHRKNLQVLKYGKSLLQWSIENYKRWFPEATIAVGTEDKETIDLSLKLGCTIYPLIDDDLKDKRNAGLLFDEYLTVFDDRPSLLVQCTSPFTLKQDVLTALNNSLPASFAGYKGAIHQIVYGHTLSQNLQESKIIAGAFYIVKDKNIEKDWRLNEKYLSQVHMISLLDINTQEDLDRARWLARNLDQKSLDN